jgi:hypothetical protein
VEREREVRRATQRLDLTRERALRDQEAEQAQLAVREALEISRMAPQFSLTEERIRTERETQSLEIARRRALDEAEIEAGEKVARARIVSGRGMDESKLSKPAKSAKRPSPWRPNLKSPRFKRRLMWPKRPRRGRLR